MIPYRMLFTVGFNYTDMGSRLTDFLSGVIGSQYGWNQSPQPDTIANRLQQDETNLTALSAQVIKFNSPTRAYGGGSINITMPYDGWVEFVIGGGGGAGGGGDSNGGGSG